MTTIAPARWRGPWSLVFGAAARCGYRGATVDVDLAVDNARAQTGFDDFGGDEFREPLALLVRDFHAHARADVLGRQVFLRMLEVTLCTRLRLRAALALAPAIAQAEVRAPLFIVGLPRTGTTLLQALLASLPGLRTPLRWETELCAFPPLASTAARAWQRCAVASRDGFVRAVSPSIMRAHAFGPRLPEECNPLLMLSFRSLFYRLLFECPAYEDAAYASGFAGAYEWHRQHVRLLQHGTKPATWVFKGPLHLAALPALLRVYPDARLIFTHRDPLAAFPSLVSLGSALRALLCPGSDRAAVGRDLLPWLARMQRAADEARGAWPATAPAALDVHYDALVADPAAVVRGVLAHFALPVPDGIEAIVARHLAAHPQHRHGRHRYALADTGIAAQAVRRTLHA